ncbi:MAG: amino acid carrier protein [Planctomycetota bacterium]|nr:MAG: amino acid carrier protein [Planctomycetota bacterium]
MEWIGEILGKLGNYSWNLPLIFLLVGTGALFTFILWFIQARRFGHALRIIRGDYDNPEDEGDITHFQALCAALSATIGVGNIAGVATAIHMGGPGAVFWMWVTAFVGMATKYATCLLSQKYRYVHEDGTVSGGPMYYIEKGLGPRFKWLAILFAFCAAVASFGGGNMVQSNSMTDAFINYFGTPRLTLGKPLAELNDGQGIRQAIGEDFRIITQSGQKITIDIGNTKNLGQWIALINNHPDNKGKRLDVEWKKNRFLFHDLTLGKGEFRVLPKGPGFAELQIKSLSSSTRIIETAPLPYNFLVLNDGRGFTPTPGKELWFRLSDGSTIGIDLEGITTPEQLIKAIREHPGNRLVLASIHYDQKHLRIRDFTKGDQTFRLEPVNSQVSIFGFTQENSPEPRRVFSKKAEKELTQSTPLAIWNHGAPLSFGEGEDLEIHLQNGKTFYIDLDGLKKVGEFLSAVNHHPENKNLVLAQIQGPYLVLTDLSQGQETFYVRSYSPILKDFWFFQSRATKERPNIIQNQTPERMAWRVLLGLFIAISVGLVIVGGIRRIGQVASKLVPFMCVLYILGALTILFLNYDKIPEAFGLIFYHAFHSTGAVEGGFMGATVLLTLQWGVKRAVFSNEAGLGSAPIAHAAAKTKEPVREGLVAMTGPFIDTIVICTMTALVIIVTDQWALGENGAALTQDAFTVGLPFYGLGGLIVALGLILFAFSTSISWSYYGDRCVEYLFGEKAIMPYRWIFCGFLFIGAVWSLKPVWDFADFTMAAMAFPNLIGTIALSGVVISMTKDYFSRPQIPWKK